jgi:hypothetical protein
MEIGGLRGLTFDTGQDKLIQDLQYQDQAIRQKQALDTAKAKMFADDLEFQQGSNPFDAQLIRQEGEQIMGQLGQLRESNPNFWYDPGAQAQAKFLKQSMRSTPSVLRSISYKTAKDGFIKDAAEAAKNPEQWDLETMGQWEQKFSNYDKYGHPDGPEGIKRDGGPIPMVYQAPQKLIDVTGELLKSGKNINNFNVIKGKNLGEYMTEPKAEEVKAIKDAFMNQHSRAIQIQAERQGIRTPEQLDDWLTKSIVAGFEPKYDPGDPNALWERGMRERELAVKQQALDGKGPKEPSYTPFDDLTDPRKPAGNVPAEVAEKVWGITPKIYVQPNTIVGKNYKGIDLTGLPVKYDNRYVTDGRGVRYLTAKVDVPMQIAANTGIWGGPADDEDAGISEAFLGKAVRRLNPKGNQVIQMDVMIPIDKNDKTARQLYNSKAQPAKLSEPLQRPDTFDEAASGMPQTIEQDGYTYTLNPQTGTYE